MGLVIRLLKRGNMSEIQLKPAEVSAVLQIHPATLTNWMKTGIVENLDVQRKGTSMGRARRYGEGDFYALAILAAASKFGILSRLIGQYARVAVEDFMRSGQWRNIHIRYSEWAGPNQAIEISYSPPAEGEGDFVITIRTERIIEQARDNLRLLNAGKAVRARFLGAEESAGA